jgi:hypothetical protein
MVEILEAEMKEDKWARKNSTLLKLLVVVDSTFLKR